MKKFNMGVHEKIQFLGGGGGSRKTNIKGKDISKQFWCPVGSRKNSIF